MAKSNPLPLEPFLSVNVFRHFHFSTSIVHFISAAQYILHPLLFIEDQTQVSSMSSSFL